MYKSTEKILRIKPEKTDRIKLPQHGEEEFFRRSTRNVWGCIFKKKRIFLIEKTLYQKDG